MWCSFPRATSFRNIIPVLPAHRTKMDKIIFTDFINHLIKMFNKSQVSIWLRSVCKIHRHIIEGPSQEYFLYIKMSIISFFHSPPQHLQPPWTCITLHVYRNQRICCFPRRSKYRCPHDRRYAAWCGDRFSRWPPRLRRWFHAKAAFC